MSWCFGGGKFLPKTFRKCFYGGHFFSASLMTKLTITLTLTDSHDDENYILLCSGVNLV